MKPKLFVGSSTEGLAVAESVQRVMGHVSSVTLWNQGIFGLNRQAFQELIGRAKYFDYSIFVFSADDHLTIRDQQVASVRDNVLFEFGFFSAVLGSDRCFFLVPRDDPNFHLPSDLKGLTYAPYSLRDHDQIDGAIGQACAPVMGAIRRPGKLSGEWSLQVADNGEPPDTMYIIQTGSRVTAALTINSSSSSGPSRRFVYEGRYLSGQIILHFEQEGAEDLIIGSMTMRVETAGQRMQGVSAFWHHDKAKMVVTPFTLTRPTPS